MIDQETVREEVMEIICEVGDETPIGMAHNEIGAAIAAAEERGRRAGIEEAMERAAQVAKQSQMDCFCKYGSDELLGGMPCAACMEAARIEGTLRGLAYRALARRDSGKEG